MIKAMVGEFRRAVVRPHLEGSIRAGVLGMDCDREPIAVVGWI
jgi:hypothetical protein